MSIFAIYNDKVKVVKEKPIDKVKVVKRFELADIFVLRQKARLRK